MQSSSLIVDYRMGTFKAQEPPCLSLYQPTHRHYPAKQQDPIRFKNLLKMLEQSLRHKYAAAEIQSLLQPFEELGEDRDFWKFTHDGLAVLAAPGFFRYYRLQRIVPEFALVADSFHLKPILRIVQSADYYQILGLNRREIKLYQGNRDIVDAIEPAAGVPRTIVDALGAELTEPHLTVASYGTGASGPAMHHGHGSKADELDIDIERFFRAVDRAVLEHHSRPSRLPLVLAALPEYHGVFRQVSHNPFLVFEYIDSYPGALSPEALRQRVWTVIEPTYLARLADLLERFNSSQPHGLASSEPEQVAEAAVGGRVGTLLLEAERRVPGRVDRLSGRIEAGVLAHPEIDDVLDDIGELVADQSGEVVVVPSNRMPVDTGLAAIYRF
jgi:hypothetical protein